MKKGRWLLVLSIVVLAVSFLPLHLFLPKMSLLSGNYSLAPGNVEGTSVFLPFQSVVVLDLDVAGANRDVYFYITDGSARRVFGAGRVYDGYHLEWRSPGFNSYTFNFDNTMSTFSSKQVSYTIQVYPYSTIFLFLGIILLLGGVWQVIREEKLIRRVKGFLFKQPEPQHMTCEYCGEIYNRTLDRCPHCGARKITKPAPKA